MQGIISNLEDMLRSYTDYEDDSILINNCDVILSNLKGDIAMACEYMPDNIAFGLFPYVHLTEKGRMFVNQFDDLTQDGLPSWEKLREMELFQISGEVDFICSLPEYGEEQAVKILIALAFVKAN